MSKLALSLTSIILLFNYNLALPKFSKYRNLYNYYSSPDDTIILTQCLFDVSNPSCQNYGPIENCDTDIIFSVDASIDVLPPFLFDMEINLIKDNITNNWNNFNQVALIPYTQEPNLAYSFGSIQSKTQFDLDLSSISQSNGTSLSELLKGLNTLTVTPGSQLSTFVFITYTTTDELTKAKIYADQLKAKGTLNFIILGNLITADDLNPLNASNIFYWTFSTQCISPLVNFVETSLSCSNQCNNTSTILSTTTITPTTTVITSTSSPSTSTQTSTTVTSSIVPSTSTETSTIITSTQSPSITTQEPTTVSYSTESSSGPSTQEPITASYSTESSSGSGTQELTTASYSTESSSGPSTQELTTGSISTESSSGPSTQEPTTGSISTGGSTSSPATTESVTPGSSCQDNIIFALDASLDISDEQFSEEKSIVAYNITDIFTDYSLLSLIGYNDINPIVYPYNNISDKNNWVSAVNSLTSNTGYTLNKLMEDLNSFNISSNNKQSVFIFLSQTTSTEVTNSIQFATNLLSKGTLNFIFLANDLTTVVSPLNPSNTYIWYFNQRYTSELVSWIQQSRACEALTTISPPSSVSTNFQSTSMITSPSTYETSTLSVSETPSSTIKPTCNNDVYFVIDYKTNVNEDLFKQQAEKIKFITEDWDISTNYASVDINSIDNSLLYLLYPVAHPSSISLYTSSVDFLCSLSYLEQNGADFSQYCTTKTMSPLISTNQTVVQTMDMFLDEFNLAYQTALQEDEITEGPKNSFTFVMFIDAVNQDEVTNSINKIQSIQAQRNQYIVKPIFITLSNSNPSVNYTSTLQFDFNDPNLKEEITNAICP
uniref:VWFA domain-containing protein n=1 Tax=Parastrongyloides trichosuri TaxID=131310 RepID=A0A0N4Z4E2_PARTI